jgi:Bacterial TSP3 repeat
VIFDHCSASWSVDECCSTSGADVDNVTVQWCIISESLNDSYHHKGPHGYGSLIRAGGNVTYHHNLYAHHMTRAPRPGTYGERSILFDFRNNVIYDTNGYSAEDPVRMNYVGNYIRRPRKWVFKVGGSETHIFQAGNVLESSGNRNNDFWQLIEDAQPENRQAEAYEVAPVKTDPALLAFKSVLDSAGATLPHRDPVDARVVMQVRQGKGKIIDSQREVGGWPEYHSTPPPQDTDDDGMSDAWEALHNFQPTVADHNADADGDGYTNLEEFLNGTDPQARL